MRACGWMEEHFFYIADKNLGPQHLIEIEIIDRLSHRPVGEMRNEKTRTDSTYQKCYRGPDKQKVTNRIENIKPNSVATI